MDSVKTAISLKKPLFDEVEELAKKMKVPRSRIFTIALEDYIRRQESRRMLEQINEVYSKGLDPEEEKLRSAYRRQQRRIVKDQW